MSIPKLTQDLAVIQKLSDLPNSTDGLTAEGLKAKFDEAVLAVQKYLNERLIPALTAAQLPFAASTEINAQNIQDAIASVHAQIKDAATGTLVNGSVTREKLAVELLARTFGGRPWVSMNVPTSEDNEAADFPVGQIWLKPAFTVVNAAGESWAGNGCTVTDGVVTGNKTSSVATATQSLTGIGQEGDRVLILFDVENRSAEVSGITVSVNGGEALDASAGQAEGILTAGGALQVRFTTTWNSASLASEGWTMADYTVVNQDQTIRQAGEAEEPKDWTAYLHTLRPFTTHVSPEAVYIQTIDGGWWAIMTGAEETGSYLRMGETAPEWAGREAVLNDLGCLRVAQGSYTGNGENRTVSLPVEPLVLVVAPEGGPVLDASGGSYYDNPVTLVSGASSMERYTDGSSYRTVAISLTGYSLKLSGGAANAETFRMNRSGMNYKWVAVY